MLHLCMLYLCMLHLCMLHLCMLYVRMHYLCMLHLCKLQAIGMIFMMAMSGETKLLELASEVIEILVNAVSRS